MVRKIDYQDIEKVNKLGILYDEKFPIHYPITDYLFNDAYISNLYEDNGIIKGFIIGTILYGTLEIHLIYVADEYRKQGVASALINDCLKSYDVEKALLEVSIYNTPAINLYKKLGFKKITVREKYYNTIDAYVMEMNK